MEGFVVVAGTLDPGGLPNPLGKEVVQQAGAWLLNYQHWPLTMLGAGAGLYRHAGGFGAGARGQNAAGGFCVLGGECGGGDWHFCRVDVSVLSCPAAAIFARTLTVWDATSSHLTLTVMFFAIILIMPVVVAYTGWAFNVMRGKVTAEYVRENDHSAY